MWIARKTTCSLCTRCCSRMLFTDILQMLIHMHITWNSRHPTLHLLSPLILQQSGQHWPSLTDFKHIHTLEPHQIQNLRIQPDADPYQSWNTRSGRKHHWREGSEAASNNQRKASVSPSQFDSLGLTLTLCKHLCLNGLKLRLTICFCHLLRCNEVP